MAEEKKQKKWIPQKAENEGEYAKLPADTRECLRYSVLTQLPNSKVFGRFFPEYCDKKGKLTERGKDASDAFFGLEMNRKYRADYKQTLEKALGGYLAEPTEEISDTRKDKALKSLFHKVMSLVEGKGEIDTETLKIATEMFKKLGLLKDDEEQVEAPRRYLPVRCMSECQYRLFCENALKKGQIVNECLYCKALAIAQEHGYKYDPKTNLSIPQKK